MVPAGALGSISHRILSWSDVDGTAMEAKYHDSGPIQEERHNWEPTRVSPIRDCLVSSKAHQKASMKQSW